MPDSTPAVLLLALSLLLSSCFYSGKQQATYTIKPKGNDARTQAIGFINQLAVQNALTKDPQYNGYDTLGFYGKPYHYFKFWFEQHDTTLVLKMDYSGSFGSRKNKPYKDFFIALNTFMEENFIIIEQHIKEENNLKKDKNKHP